MDLGPDLLLPRPDAQLCDDGRILLTFGLPDGRELNLFAAPQTAGAFTCDADGNGIAPADELQIVRAFQQMRIAAIGGAALRDLMTGDARQ